MAEITHGVKYWFNDIARLWGTITDDKGKRVTGYTLERAPESVTKVPCAISFLDGNIDAAVSYGGPSMVVYRGKTEFHLTMGLQRDQLPYVMSFPDKVIEKVASSITLGGKVVHFGLDGPIQVAQLTWGNESEHYGLIVPWMVQENQSGKYDVIA